MAAESSFEGTGSRVLEHHNVVIPTSAIRAITLDAGQKAKSILEAERSGAEDQLPEQLVVEMDGVMVPVVDYSESKDRRKTKKLRWMEMKVGAIQNPSRLQTAYACSFEGAERLGEKMGVLMREIAGEFIPPIHGVGGCQYAHLIDYFHLCEYLHEAFDAHKRQDLMVKRSKDEAKSGKMNQIVRRLKRKQKRLPQHEGVRNCLRYIRNRPGQFAYAKAVDKGLPIGSGLIESTNRSLVQKRLKLPGAWWVPENAEKIVQLRVLRANDQWGNLWSQAA